MLYMCKKVVCFDLDDTLYKEIDFVESAFGEIAASVGHPELIPLMMDWFHKGENVFQLLNDYTGKEVPISEYLAIYRNHFPNIVLSEGIDSTLSELTRQGVILGLITDGRSVTQRNKIKALQLERWFDERNIVISEEFGSDKMNRRNFRYFRYLYPEAVYSYVGDNPEKDFIVPNMLLWKTILLKDNGRNIHGQDTAPEGGFPRFTIAKMTELLRII